MSDVDRMPALIMKMKALRSSLSKSEVCVIDYIIDHPEEVVYLSVSGLAESSGVSVATVIRACKDLGMSGYQDLKVTLAQDIVTPLQSIHEEISADDSASTIMDKVFQSSIHTLRFTYDTLKVDLVEKAAAIIDGSAKVIIFGLGNSQSIAIDLQHKLMRLGITAFAYTDTHMQIIAATYLGPQDTVFAISHSGSSKDVVDAAELAKKQGSKVIALTNIGKNPLGDIADIQLTTASNESHYRIVALASRVAQMTIIDAIYTIIATKRGQQAVDQFRSIEKALESKKY
jgi:DNA-binding MurR/RpiR family transcriptional regulator